MTTTLAPLMPVRRWLYKLESARATPSGSAFKPKAYQDFIPATGQAALSDDRQLDEYMINYASWPGVKSFSAAVLTMLNEDTYTECAPLIKAALGADSSAAVLTINGAGAHTDGTIVMTNSNLPAPIIVVTGNDGKKYPRPVKAFNTGTFVITLAIKLPAGVLPTAVRNPAAAGGACWQESQAVAPTFYFEADRAGQTNETKVQGYVNVVSELSLRFDIQNRLGLGFGFTGAEWTIGGSLATAATAKNLQQYLAYNSVCFKQGLTVPVAPVKRALRGLTLDLAPEWVPIVGQTGNDGDATEPESNLIGWERGRSLIKGLGLQFATPDTTKFTDRSAMTAEQTFLMFKSRVGGGLTPTAVLCIWFPETTANDVPMPAANGGVEAMDQPFIVGQSTLLSAAESLLHKCACAILTY